MEKNTKNLIYNSFCIVLASISGVLQATALGDTSNIVFGYWGVQITASMFTFTAFMLLAIRYNNYNTKEGK